ncbi:hypothetical protein [Paenibacillus bovis]|uniref:Flp pilus assembly protein, ATPase CpaE n=1 Tax=Paenibacillus bovis TaxID=1616788 RepID=A0A1X9T426_9BACL|nr:hypothetical protein [Paenibacillus bovis]ARR10720.1 hypothetical protein AR543_p0112 [Paenibacillus bovis]
MIPLIYLHGVPLETDRLTEDALRLFASRDLPHLFEQIELAQPHLVVLNAVNAPTELPAIRQRLADCYPDQEAAEPMTEIVVLVEHEEAEAARHWTEAGASEVWLLSDWPEQLLDYAAQPIQEEAPAASKVHRIAVASAHPNSGSTHTSLLLAMYLQEVCHARVAIWECGVQGLGTYRHMLYTLGGEQTLSMQYKLHGLTIIDSVVDDQTIEILQQEFDYIIYDMGTLQCAPHEYLFFRAEVPIFLCEGASWKLPKGIQILNSFASKRRIERVQLLIPYANQEIMNMVKHLEPGRMSYAMPMHREVFEIQPESSKVIEALLAPLGPILKASSLSNS